MLSNYISWIVFGALTGWTISQIFPPRTSKGLVSTMFIGGGGAFLAGLLIKVILGEALAGFNVAILIGTVLVSIFLLTALRNFVHD